MIRTRSWSRIEWSRATGKTDGSTATSITSTLSAIGEAISSNRKNTQQHNDQQFYVHNHFELLFFVMVVRACDKEK